MRKYYPWFIVLIFVVVSVPVGCHIFGPSNHSVKDYTQLCADAQAGRVDAIKLAVRNDRAALKARDWDEATLLHLTIGQNHKELAIYLLMKGWMSMREQPIVLLLFIWQPKTVTSNVFSFCWIIRQASMRSMRRVGHRRIAQSNGAIPKPRIS